MSVRPDSKDFHKIRQLIPIKRIANDRFADLCEKISVEQAEAGGYLFKQGDADTHLFYLIDGRISLQTDEFKVETISSESESSQFALAHQVPRKIDAYAETDIRFLRVNTDMINTAQKTLYEEETNSMIVEEPENNDDWMTTLLKSPIFRALPPANLQRILMGLEEVHYKQGETIISQGEPGDYYYLIKQGQCLITRKPTPAAKEIKLAQLQKQDTFGEDALLSDEPRNVTVRALTDVSLLRLNKPNFISLIKEPSMKFVDYQQTTEEIAKGAILMDVRSPDEYEKDHLKNSMNVPFFSLRMHLKNLNKKQSVIVVCENGKTSEAAAFLLLRNKINAFVLKGGMQKVPDQNENQSNKATFLIDEDSIETNLQPISESQSTATQNTQTEEKGISEIEQLRQTVAQLEAQCKTLTEERDELSRKYKMLFKQTEKLKSVLDSLKNNGETN